MSYRKHPPETSCFVYVVGVVLVIFFAVGLWLGR